ncbi:MAG: DUF58 domain-containing protein [Ilumatobacteraceae bacterium]
MTSTAGQRVQVRLTATGLSVVVISLLALVVWVLAGYVEFVLVALVGLVLVGLALLWPRVASDVTFVRINPPRLVGRGDVMAITLEAESSRATPPARLIDQIAGATVEIPLPALRAEVPVEIHYRIRALRRGVHQLGPLLEARSDPLSVVTRTVEHDEVNEVLVHPRILPLTNSDGGARILQNRARLPRLSDDPLADFRSLREYVVGDDERLVHWPTVARTGTLMVRDHFELRRTTRLVVLETLDSAGSEQQFEDAAEIAASIVCESLDRTIAVGIRSRDVAHPGRLGTISHRSKRSSSSPGCSAPRPPRPCRRRRCASQRHADQIFVVAPGNSPLLARLADAVTRTAARDGADRRPVAPGTPAAGAFVRRRERRRVRWSAARGGGRMSVVSADRRARAEPPAPLAPAGPALGLRSRVRRESWVRAAIGAAAAAATVAIAAPSCPVCSATPRQAVDAAIGAVAAGLVASVHRRPWYVRTVAIAAAVVVASLTALAQRADRPDPCRRRSPRASATRWAPPGPRRRSHPPSCRSSRSARSPVVSPPI